MKKLQRDPLRFDIFNALAVYGREENISLQKPETSVGFVERIRKSIGESLTNDRFLHGLRTQAMFEGLVAALGQVRLLKQEDAGSVYALDDSLEIPDFRLILLDGTQLLVEVKNCYQPTGREPLSFSGKYLDGLLSYGEIVKCPLKLAVYWARWNLWTMIPLEVVQRTRDEAVLTMTDAIQACEMSSIGDVRIGTKYPLSLVLRADRSKPRSVDTNGEGQFMIEGADFFCGDQQIRKPLEQRIAYFLMLYGGWKAEEPVAKITDGLLDAITHKWNPHESSDQGFEIVGSLSSIFSSFYSSVTLENGKVNRLQVNFNPGSLGALIPKGYEGQDLPLWRMVMQPNSITDAT